jgi:hypothetical protein
LLLYTRPPRLPLTTLGTHPYAASTLTAAILRLNSCLLAAFFRLDIGNSQPLSPPSPCLHLGQPCFCRSRTGQDRTGQDRTRLRTDRPGACRIAHIDSRPVRARCWHFNNLGLLSLQALRQEILVISPPVYWNWLRPTLDCPLPPATSHSCLTVSVLCIPHPRHSNYEYNPPVPQLSPLLSSTSPHFISPHLHLTSHPDFFANTVPFRTIPCSDSPTLLPLNLFSSSPSFPALEVLCLYSLLSEHFLRGRRPSTRSVFSFENILNWLL